MLQPIQVKKIKPMDNVALYNDGGGLYLRVTKYKTKVTKEWIFRFLSPVTKARRKQTIGYFPTTSLKDARDLAQQNRKLLERNIDPIEQAKKLLAIEIENHREQQRKNAKTVEVVFYEWKYAELKNRKDKGYDIHLAFKKDVFPSLGNKPIHKVTREDIKLVLDFPVKRGAKRQANELLSNLKQFFRYADDDELIGADPTRKFTKARVGGKQQSRKRVLKKPELILLKEKLATSDFGEQYKHAIYFYLATGCRRNELISAELSSCDLKERNFNIPSDKAKNTDEHNIYLSDFALAQIEKIAALSTSEKWLFPNKKETAHISQGVISRNIRLRQPQQHKPGNSKWQKKHTNEFELPNGHWVLHDLRRTAATIMQELGVMPHIVKKCLNQRTEDKIMETYQRAELLDQQQSAFEKLGEYLTKIFG